MSFDYINEAFRKLNMLDEEVFDTSIGGLNNLSNFMENDDEDIVKVIDPEAETEDSLSNSYVGKVIIDCNVCHSKIFSEKADIVLGEDGVVNPEEQCPYCGETAGFTVVGEIKKFEQDTAEETPENETPADETPVEETETEEGEEKSEVEESLTEELDLDGDDLDEGIFDRFKKKTAEETPVEEPQKEEPKKEEDAFPTYSYDEWIQALEYGHKYYAEDGPEAGRMKLWDKAMEIAASKNLCKDVTTCMDAWMKHRGSNNFPHKSYAKHLQEGAFSGGYAGDNSFSGGTVRGRGASTQPSKSTYLRRLQSKNPDLVDIAVVKGKDIKPGMITQAGQVKTAEVKKNNRGETKVYIMHTNNYDGFWDVDEDMEVLADPENKSQPFTGAYRDLLKMGLQESDITDDAGKDSLNEEFDAFTAVSTFLTGKGYDVSSKDGKAYVWGVVDYLDMGGIDPTTENLESWLTDTLANEEYRSELESCCKQHDVQEELSVDVDSLDEAYFRPVEGEEGVKRALIESCNEYTVTLLEITDEDGVWYEVGINHPTQDFEQVEIGEYKTQQFAEDIAQKVVDLLNKYVDLEELSGVYDFNTRNIYNKIASRMPETEPTTEELHEDIQNLSLTTDETQVKLTSDENGKVTLVTEPVIKEDAESEVIDEPAAEGELEIAPVSDETVDAIVDNNEVETEEDKEIPEEPVEEAGEEDVALDEVDEEGLDELGESYMKAVYENVASFRTTNVSANDTHIVVEGLIKFTSGTERKTGFIFEAHTARDNKVNFRGCNEHFSKDRNSFTLDCSVVDRKLLPESLSYNYDVDGRKISGTVTRKGV